MSRLSLLALALTRRFCLCLAPQAPFPFLQAGGTHLTIDRSPMRVSVEHDGTPLPSRLRRRSCSLAMPTIRRYPASSPALPASTVTGQFSWFAQSRENRRASDIKATTNQVDFIVEPIAARSRTYALRPSSVRASV